MRQLQLVLGSILLLLAGCASPPVPDCAPEAVAKPAIEAACRGQLETGNYVAQVSARLNSKLEHRWQRTDPGQLHLRLEYDAESEVESLCVLRRSGQTMGPRSDQALAGLKSLQRAPDCFADRRIEIDWESAIVTEVELRHVLSRCGANLDAGTRLNVCALGCAVDESMRLSEGDDAVFSCMVSTLPLAFRASGGDELFTFLPADPSADPTLELVFTATEACDDRLPTHERLVQCMRAHGFDEVDWNADRQSLFD